MDWAGISILGLTGLALGIYAGIIWLCIAANLIVRHRFERPTEDECDDLANGDMPHLAPDFLTSFHAASIAQEEEPGRV